MRRTAKAPVSVGSPSAAALVASVMSNHRSKNSRLLLRVASQVQISSAWAASQRPSRCFSANGSSVTSAPGSVAVSGPSIPGSTIAQP